MCCRLCFEYPTHTERRARSVTATQATIDADKLLRSNNRCMLALSKSNPCDSATTQTLLFVPKLRQTPTGELAVVVALSPVSSPTL